MTLVTNELLLRRRGRLSSMLFGMSRLFLMINRFFYFTLVLYMNSLPRSNVLLWMDGLLSGGMLFRMSRFLDMGFFARSLFDKVLILD